MNLLVSFLHSYLGVRSSAYRYGSPLAMLRFLHCVRTVLDSAWLLIIKGLLLLLLATAPPRVLAEAILDFDIDRQSFSTALQQFAKQADLQLMYSPEAIPEHISPAVKGRFLAREALALLIENTNLEFVFNGLIVVIREQTAKAVANTESVALPEAGPEPEGQYFIEEFIVTAQKREERLQDVPISILLAQGEDLQVAGINRLESLAPLMPGFHYSEAVAANDQLFIRGLGSGVNFGFENAVGQVIDDFYYGRSRFGRAAFLDVERVEILKGPQGALIGKNTTAGAINITSKIPTDHFEGWVSANYEFEADQGYTMEGALSGPLSETLAARLALRIDQHDGWTHNSVTGKDSQAMGDITGRLTATWHPDAPFNATLRYQKGDLNREGRAREISRCGQRLLDFIAQNDLPEDCRVNLKRSAVGVRNGVGDFQDFNTDFDTFGLTLNREFSQSTLTSLTGYANYKVNDQVISDLLPLELGNLDALEEWSQWTQELRISSDKNSQLDYILGFYFIHTDQTSGLDVHFTDQPLENRATRVIATRQEGDSYAVFGQITWQLSAALSATVGARYTLEEEDARSKQFAAALYTRNPTAIASGPAAGGHDVAQDRREDDLSPSLTLQWHPTDEMMLYASIRKGFKGGGFDHQLVAEQSAAEQNFQFNKEQVVAYELGSKWVFGGGSSQMNFAIFRNEFDNIQVSSVQDNITFSVGNAASAITQRIEFDGRWRPSKNLNFSWSMAYLDARYNDFANAPCSDEQVRASSPDCRLLTPTTGIQDLSDKRLQYAPEWAVFTSAEYIMQLSDRLALISTFEAYYSDKVALALDLDPYTFQKEYAKINARFTLTNDRRDWEISAVLRNLTDEITSNFSNDLSGVFSEGSYFRLVESPRAFSVQGLIRF